MNYKLTNVKSNKDYRIMKEISECCETCFLREKCIEEECVLFRIEKIVVGNRHDKKGGSNGTIL